MKIWLFFFFFFLCQVAALWGQANSITTKQKERRLEVLGFRKTFLEEKASPVYRSNALPRSPLREKKPSHPPPFNEKEQTGAPAAATSLSEGLQTYWLNFLVLHNYAFEAEGSFTHQTPTWRYEVSARASREPAVVFLEEGRYQERKNSQLNTLFFKAAFFFDETPTAGIAQALQFEYRSQQFGLQELFANTASPEKERAAKVDSLNFLTQYHFSYLSSILQLHSSFAFSFGNYALQNLITPPLPTKPFEVEAQFSLAFLKKPAKGVRLHWFYRLALLDQQVLTQTAVSRLRHFVTVALSYETRLARQWWLSAGVLFPLFYEAAQRAGYVSFLHLAAPFYVLPSLSFIYKPLNELELILGAEGRVEREGLAQHYLTGKVVQPGSFARYDELIESYVKIEWQGAELVTLAAKGFYALYLHKTYVRLTSENYLENVAWKIASTKAEEQANSEAELGALGEWGQVGGTFIAQLQDAYYRLKSELSYRPLMTSKPLFPLLTARTEFAFLIERIKSEFVVQHDFFYRHYIERVGRSELFELQKNQLNFFYSLTVVENFNLVFEANNLLLDRGTENNPGIIRSALQFGLGLNYNF